MSRYDTAQYTAPTLNCHYNALRHVFLLQEFRLPNTQIQFRLHSGSLIYPKYFVDFFYVLSPFVQFRTYSKKHVILEVECLLTC